MLSLISFRRFAVALCASAFVSSACAAGSVVRVAGTEGNWHLTFNGKPFFVRGVGGHEPKDLLRDIGGNGFRTWGADDAAAQLAEGLKAHQTVLIGFWLGHPEHGYSYANAGALAEAKASILAKVREVKDSPALLGWALGNEMELGNPHPDLLWKFVNDVAIAIKEIDPNHPVGTVIAEINREKIGQIERWASALDFVGINSYGGVNDLGKRWIEGGAHCPYMITEFGIPGAGETGWESTGCAFEWNSTGKAGWYANAYKNSVEAYKNTWCLGSYAFLWGNKVEGTPTWFGLLTGDGRREILAAAEELQKAWGKKPLTNRCPVIDEGVKASNQKPAAGEDVIATIEAHDPDGDTLVYEWLLRSEMGYYGATGGGAGMPRAWEDAIVEGQGTRRAKVRLPGGGTYRLYVTIRDGKGRAALDNITIKAAGGAPKSSRPAEALPFVVYGDRIEHGSATGFMGAPADFKFDAACIDAPASGTRCIRVDYSGRNGWAGLFWQNPAGDWGNADGAFNLSKATKLRFRARGANGGERVTIGMGGLEGNVAYPDRAKDEFKDLVLTKQWKDYEINLAGKDLGEIKTLFRFIFSNNGGPFTFFLDDVRYE